MSFAATATKQPSGAPPKKALKPAPVVSSASGSPAFEDVAFQLLDAPASPAQEESEANSTAADALAAASPYGVIIEDGLPAGEGQVNRTQFMEELASAIESTADDLLKPAGKSAQDCPYLSFWLNYYRNQSAAHIERAIARYVKPAQRDRDGIEQAVLSHVGEAVQAWIDHREIQVPGQMNLLAADDGVPDTPGEGAAAQRKGADGVGSPAAPGSAAAIRSQLSNGRPLESAVRLRMERGFGVSFGDVQLHTDGEASRLAHAFSARAFTVGNHVAFAGGFYRPDNIAGTALLAHELAHVVQQRGGSNHISRAADSSLEADANSAAETVLRSSLNPGGAVAAGTKPRFGLAGGLRLQRCSSKESPPPAPAPKPEEEMRVILTEVLKDHTIEPAEWQRVNERALALNITDIVLADLTHEKPIGGLSLNLADAVGLIATGKGSAFATLRSAYRATYAEGDESFTPSPIPDLLKAALADSSLDFEELDAMRRMALRGKLPDFGDLQEALTKANIAPASVTALMKVVDISGVAWNSLRTDPLALPLRFTAGAQGELAQSGDLRIVFLRAITGDGAWSSLEFPKIRDLLLPLGRAGAKKLLTDAGFGVNADQLAKQFTADAATYSQRMRQEIHFKRDGNNFALETPFVVDGGKGPSANLSLPEDSTSLGDYTFKSGITAPAVRRQLQLLGKNVPVIFPNRSEDFFLVVRGGIMINEGVGSLPQAHLALIQTIVVDPGEMVDAAADAGREGVVTLYVGGAGGDPRRIMIHETGHLVSFKADAADSAFWTKWRKAADDDSAAVSLYGTTNQLEDFAEAYLLYIVNQADAEKRFPNRAAILNPLVHPVAPKGPPAKP